MSVLKMSTLLPGTGKYTENDTCCSDDYMRPTIVCIILDLVCECVDVCCLRSYNTWLYISSVYVNTMIMDSLYLWNIGVVSPSILTARFVRLFLDCTELAHESCFHHSPVVSKKEFSSGSQHVWILTMSMHGLELSLLIPHCTVNTGIYTENFRPLEPGYWNSL